MMGGTRHVGPLSKVMDWQSSDPWFNFRSHRLYFVILLKNTESNTNITV